jgi:peptide-methionine (S)-S-oxide reductase
MTIFDELGLSKLLGPIPDRETPVAHGARDFVNGRPLDPPFPRLEQVLSASAVLGRRRKFWRPAKASVTAVITPAA